MSKSLKDVGYLVLSNAVLKVLGIISVVVYTRFLIKEELALVPLLTIIGRLSMVVFSFGILSSLVRDVPHLLKENKTDEVRSLIKTSLSLIVPGILVFSLICYFFSAFLSQYFFNSDKYEGHLQLMAAGFFFSGVNHMFSYIYWSLSRFRQESKRLVVIGFMQLVLSIVSVSVWGIFGLLTALVITSFFNTVFFIYNLKDIVLFGSFTLYPLKTLLSDSLPFYLESYLQYFRAEGDQLLVATLLGPGALAIYFIARKPYDFLHSFTQSLDKVLTTSLAKFKNDKAQFNKTVNNIITLNSYILFPLIFLTIGIAPTFIVLIAGPGYVDAIVPSILLLFWLITQQSWKTAFGKSIFVLKSSMGRFKVTLVETVTLLGLMCLLGYFFKLDGIVSGRFMATILAGIYAYQLIKRDISLSLDFRCIGLILFHCIIMCSLLLLVQYVSSNYFIVFSAVLLAAVGFLFLINRTVSRQYYTVLNTVSPIKIEDPFTYLYGKLRGLKLKSISIEKNAQ